MDLTSNNVKTYVILFVKLCYTLVLCIPILYTKIKEFTCFHMIKNTIKNK